MPRCHRGDPGHESDAGMQLPVGPFILIMCSMERFGRKALKKHSSGSFVAMAKGVRYTVSYVSVSSRTSSPSWTCFVLYAGPLFVLDPHWCFP
jgi:hypothetical protein